MFAKCPEIPQIKDVSEVKNITSNLYRCFNNTEGRNAALLQKKAHNGFVLQQVC